MSAIRPTDLAWLDAQFKAALDTGDESALTVLGYGEISSVIAFETSNGNFAAKRLPPFDSRDRYERYAELFSEYIETLQRVGIRVVPSTLQAVEQPDGLLAVYCLQPIVDARTLAPAVLARASEAEAHRIFERVLAAVIDCVAPTVGLDAQLSNWAFADDELLYFDVTTPLVRDIDGKDRLDADLYLAAIPWFLRGIVKRRLLTSITGTFFSPRSVLVDFLGNLIKERLDGHLEAFIQIANARLDDPITSTEVRNFYRWDARLWSVLVALRRMDRFWQRRVRGRPYPFLLPGPVTR